MTSDERDPEDGYDPGSGDGLAELPPDPVSSYEAERAQKEVGGVIVATFERAKQDRLTIGAWQHRSGMRHLKAVTIRMYRDGERTDALDLGPEDVYGMITALREAAAICWPPPATG